MRSFDLLRGCRRCAAGDLRYVSMKSSHATFRLAIGALAAVVCVSAGTVFAASGGRPASLDERIQGSHKVIVATARNVDASWRQNTYGDRVIVSRVLLAVDETLKGPFTSNAIWMDLEGGTLDGFTLRVSDLPELKPGERAVFFLDQSADGMTTPHLRGQGILKLDQSDVVTGSSLRLDDIRRAAQSRK